MKKVCLLGTSNTWKQAPFGDTSIEIWALNDMYDIVDVARISRWFEIHGAESIAQSRSRITDLSHEDELKKLAMPVYMQDVCGIPSSVRYPLEEIAGKFRQFFKSTLDYMIALALFEGYEEIHIYGVDMSDNEEYRNQRASMLYWIGRAEGMGVNIVLPEGCDLMKSYFRYGYDDEKQDDLIVKAKAKSAELDRNSKEFMKNYYLSLGAKDTWDFILREIMP